MLSWFDANEVQQMAERLAEEFGRVYPATEVGKENKQSQVRRERATQVLFAQTKQFAAKAGLNIYKKARFGQTFQQALVSRGYDVEFVRTLTKEVLFYLR